MFFLSVLAWLFFFIYFSTDYVLAKQARLKTAAGWAVFGMATVVFMYGRELLGIFQIDFLSDILQSRLIENIIPFIPWISEIITLIFFIVLLREMSEDERVKLRKSLIFAVIGASLSVLLRTIVVVNYILTRGEMRWFADFRGTLLIIGIPLIIISFLAIEYFLLSFYKGKDIL